jgi:replicative DNA helicase
MIHNLEAERAILGAVIDDPNILLELIGELTTADFYEPTNATIYQTICALQAKHTGIDLLTLTNELSNQEKLIGIGGADYLATLRANGHNVQHYATILRDARVKRDLLNAGKDIIGLGNDTTLDATSAIAKAQNLLIKITDGRSHQCESLETIGRRGEEKIVRGFDYPDEVTGLATGLFDLDRSLGGLEKQDNIVIAGRPGCGKSSLADTIAVNVAKQGKRVALFTLEMSSEQRFNRMVCIYGGHSYEEVRRRRKRMPSGAWRQWTEEEVGDYLMWHGRTETLPIFINEKSSIATSEIAARVSELSLRQPLDLIIVDYLGLVGDAPDAKRYEQIGAISRGLKGIAKSANAPLLNLAQLNRKCEDRGDKKPELSDLRDSGDIEQDADIVILIWRASMYWKTQSAWEATFKRDPYPGEHTAELNIAKFRNGATGYVNLFFDETKMRFADLQQGERK